MSHRSIVLRVGVRCFIGGMIFFQSLSSWAKVVVEQVGSFPISAANVNVFASSVGWYKGAIYTVNVEPPPSLLNTGINLRTVVRKGVQDRFGIWRWESVVLSDETLDDPYHTQASIAIDKRGFVHVAYNMHNMPWQYAVSAAPGDIGEFVFKGQAISLADRVSVKHLNKTPFPTLGSGSIPGNQITYPAFFTDNNRDLFVTYRFATRPKRPFSDRGFAGGIAKLDVESGAWHALGGTLPVGKEDADLPADTEQAVATAFAYSDRWSVYLIRLDFDAENNMHVSWMWRDGGAGPGVTHPSYAFSDDGGRSFVDNKGRRYSLPVSVNDSSLIVEGGDSRFYNPKTVIRSDSEGRAYVLLSEKGKVRSLTRLDRIPGDWSDPEDMPNSASEFLVDKAGQQWAIAFGPKIFRRDSADKPWEIVYQRDEGFGYPQALLIPERNMMVLYVQNIEKKRVKIYLVAM